MRDPKRRFDSIWRLSKDVLICQADQPDDNDDPFSKENSKPTRNHGGCGNAQPQIRKEGITLVGTWKPNKSMMDDDMDMAQPEKKTITPSVALNVFRTISQEDVRIMGLSNDYARPEWMIVTVLPVPPPPVRPSVLVGGSTSGQRGEDDLTYKLAEIVRANQNVQRCEQEGAPEHVVREFESLLQYHVGVGYTLYSDAVYKAESSSVDEQNVPKGLYHADIPTLLEARKPEFVFGPDFGYVECSLGRTKCVAHDPSSTPPHAAVAQGGRVHRRQDGSPATRTPV